MMVVRSVVVEQLQQLLGQQDARVRELEQEKSVIAAAGLRESALEEELSAMRQRIRVLEDVAQARMTESTKLRDILAEKDALVAEAQSEADVAKRAREALEAHMAAKLRARDVKIRKLQLQVAQDAYIERRLT